PAVRANVLIAAARASGSRPRYQPQPRSDDAEARSVQRVEWLVQKNRAQHQAEHRGEEEIGAYPARLAVLENPKPEHRGSHAEDQHQESEAGDQLSGPLNVRHTLQQKRGGYHRYSGAGELRAVQHHGVRALAHPFVENGLPAEREHPAQTQQKPLRASPTPTRPP